ncbi:hypothetical protein ACFXDE_02040 [Kitasatospora sp. NPDC059408]|uniref:hypothetical protein n=1 Tax=Kitasatospora sp. NPDC059408 TaxID=3346823 RepID=UPI0036804F6D
MPTTPTACPGPCNCAWRDAERTGLPHDYTPTWGQPVHCQTCQDRTRTDLTELPELLAAIWLEATHGTARPADVTTSRPAGIAPWPGQASRLLTDHIVGGLTEIEDDVRDLRGLGSRPDDVREGTTATQAVRFLNAHLDWILEHHPAANETHEPGSGNPAAQIRHFNRTAKRFTSRDARMEQKAAPCKRCDWRALAHADGADYVECRNCGLLMTPAEYQDWASEITATAPHRSAA